MEQNRYNEQQMNRKKLLYRCGVGIIQFFNFPLLNLLWVVVAICGILLCEYKSILASSFTFTAPLSIVFNTSLTISIVLFISLLIVFLLQWIGELTTRKDETAIKTALEKNSSANSYAILVQKNWHKNKTITRVFYTNIPKKCWIDNQESICDLLNVHLVKDINYYRANGNFIVIESAKGRIPKDRGILYDETF